MHLCMDWRSLHFDWNRARAFLVTAEEGSFSAAARALASTQPTIGRQVSALEEELGVTLFERIGTGLKLTASGLELLEHVRGSDTDNMLFDSLVGSAQGLLYMRMKKHQANAPTRWNDHSKTAHVVEF